MSQAVELDMSQIIEIERDLIRQMSSLELEFAECWNQRYPDIDLLYDCIKPLPDRKFVVDFAHITARVAIEIQGQIWAIGGHSSGRGLLRDYEKANLCQKHGWFYIQLADTMISDLKWHSFIAEVINARL